MPNITDTENKEETHVETTVEPVINATNPPANETSSIFGLDEADITNTKEEEAILPETSRVTMRIVNGAKCPPGDCPWQVETQTWTVLLHDT